MVEDVESVVATPHIRNPLPGRSWPHPLTMLTTLPPNSRAWSSTPTPEMTTPELRSANPRKQWEGERAWGRSAPGSQSRSTGSSVGRTTALQHPWGTAAVGLVRRWRHPIPAAWHRHGLQSRGPNRRVPPPDPRNHRGVGVRPEDLRPHPWVGRQPPLGDAGLVVNSSVPPAWVYQGSPFRFVTDGLESALAQA